jgi:hypothetical protein
MLPMARLKIRLRTDMEPSMRGTGQCACMGWYSTAQHRIEHRCTEHESFEHRPVRLHAIAWDVSLVCKTGVWSRRCWRAVHAPGVCTNMP